MIAPDRISTSLHFGSWPVRGIHVVIHATRSGQSMNPNELEGTLNWFKNPVSEVSSHWLIGRQGQKIRIIPDDKQAWHAGEHNPVMWGIELEQGVWADGFTKQQIDALVAVCRGYVTDFGVPPIHSLSQGGFTGHEETPQGRRVGKSDPGTLFPWEQFINALHGVPPTPPSPPSQEEEMIRFVAPHKDLGLAGRIIERGVHFWDVYGDFGLPSEAKLMRFEIRLRSGAIRVHDGNASGYAGEVGSDGARYGFIDAIISDGVTFYGNPTAEIELMSCIGYWH